MDKNQAHKWDVLLGMTDLFEVRELCKDGHPESLAEFLASIDVEGASQILGLLDATQQALIFSYLDPEKQLEIAETIGIHNVANFIAEMDADERVDFIKSLPEATREVLLPVIARTEREDILRLAAYDEGTAGSVMTSDYVTLYPELTAAQALNKIRLEAPDKETIYYCYVISPSRQLMGIISLKDLILAHPNTPVANIMQEEVITILADEDREKAARIIDKYDLLALPVINERNELLGIITYDDALEIIKEEQTEDMSRFMAIAGDHNADYLKTSAWVHFKNRIGWVAALAIVSLFSGLVLQYYENVMRQFFILALYIPMLTNSGGITGSQAATVIVRALALHDLNLKDSAKILFKELSISMMISLVLVSIVYIKVMFLSQGNEVPDDFSLSLIAAAVMLALAIQVITSTMIGAALPLVAQRFKIDPAVIASPGLMTLVDITGLLIYFITAREILGI